MAREITYRNEADVKKQVKKLLDKHGYFWWMPPANAFGKSGISDFHALRDGTFLAIETKFGKNKPTAPQSGFLQSIMTQSGLSFVVNDANIDWFRRWLEAFDRAAAAYPKPPAPEDGAEMLNATKVLTELMV